MKLFAALEMCKGLSPATGAEKLVASRLLESSVRNHFLGAKSLKRNLDADEIVQDALIRLLRAAPPKFLIESDYDDDHREGACHEYIKTTVTYLAIDAHRKIKRQREREASAAPGENLSAPVLHEDTDIGEDPEHEQREVLLLVQRVTDHAKEGIQERYRADFVLDCEQLQLLASRGKTMDELLATAGHDRARDPQAWQKARDSLYQRHCRARGRLKESALVLEKAEALSADEAKRVVRVVEEYLQRCQTPRSRPSSRGIGT